MDKKKWNIINRLFVVVLIFCTLTCIYTTVLGAEYELAEGSEMDTVVESLYDWVNSNPGATPGMIAKQILTVSNRDQAIIQKLQNDYTQENIPIWHGSQGNEYRGVDIAIEAIKNNINTNDIPDGSFEDQQILINEIVNMQNAAYSTNATKQELEDLDNKLRKYRNTYGFYPSEDSSFIEMANNIRNKLKEMGETGPTVADDIDNREQEREEYEEEEKNKQHGMLGSMDASTTHTPDEIITEANEFVTQASGTTIGGDKLQEASSSLYNILLSIAIGMYLGVKFMVSTAEDKAKVKEALIPYIAGCVVIFSAFIIWKFAILLLNGIA